VGIVWEDEGDTVRKGGVAIWHICYMQPGRNTKMQPPGYPVATLTRSHTALRTGQLHVQGEALGDFMESPRGSGITNTLFF
jgi:hypothetical protein